MKNKKYYDEINIAKGIGALLVVFGHSFPDASLGIYNNSDIYKFIENVIYSFHMPLFFFLSGFLTENSDLDNSLCEKIQFVKRKVNSLLIPYFIVSILTLVIKYFLSNYAYSDFDYANGIKNIIIGISPNGGMWFLYTLFLITCIYIVFYGKIDIKISTMVSLVFCFLCAGQAFDDNVLYTTAYYSFFFFLGALLYREKETMKYKKIVGWIGSLVNIIVLSLLVLLKIIYIRPIEAILGIYIVLFVSKELKERKSKISNKLCYFGKYSMDIYILSYFVQIPIRIILFEKLRLNYEFCFFTMFVFGVAGSLFLSKYFIRKTKILKILLLGSRKG